MDVLALYKYIILILYSYSPPPDDALLPVLCCRHPYTRDTAHPILSCYTEWHLPANTSSDPTPCERSKYENHYKYIVVLPNTVVAESVKH